MVIDTNHLPMHSSTLKDIRVYLIIFQEIKGMEVSKLQTVFLIMLQIYTSVTKIIKPQEQKLQDLINQVQSCNRNNHIYSIKHSTQFLTYDITLGFLPFLKQYYSHTLYPSHHTNTKYVLFCFNIFGGN